MKGSEFVFCLSEIDHPRSVEEIEEDMAYTLGLQLLKEGLIKFDRDRGDGYWAAFVIVIPWERRHWCQCDEDP